MSGKRLDLDYLMRDAVAARGRPIKVDPAHALAMVRALRAVRKAGWASDPELDAAMADITDSNEVKR